MFTRREESKPHIPARVRAYGRARIEIAQRAQTQQEWDTLWKPPSQPFAFDWGPYWKHCIEYKVADFTAEVGFFIDVLGLPVNAFNENYAMFTSPEHEFYFAVVAAEKSKPTPADALRIQFMVRDIFTTTERLQQRGIQFIQEPQPVSEGSNQWVAAFQTPNGICLEVWGLVEEQVSPTKKEPQESEGREIEQERVFASLVDHPNSSQERAIWTPGSGKDTARTENDDASREIQDEFDWQDETEDEDDEGESSQLEGNSKPEFLDETEDDEEVDSTVINYTHPDKKDQKDRIQQPLRAFQNADEMLKALEQKKSKPASIAQPLPMPDKGVEKSKLAFTPAPKKANEKKLGSVWDAVDDVEEEYVDVETSSEDEYHYTPIPLKRED